MNNFLREARKFRNLTEGLCIVLGNESCDLDSAVSSLSLAYFYYKNRDKIPLSSTSTNKKSENTNVLPLFNIKRNEFPLKTEVVYFLNLNSIDTELITFKDEINENTLKTNDLVLVDHHVTPYMNSVIAAHDHRPFDEHSNLPANCSQNIKHVGSCATLIADQILDLHNSKEYIDILRLLYGAIILDTVCFSKEADKATTLDCVVAFEIENLLKFDDPPEYRESLFNDLVRARSDISKLDSYQILLKDMKIIAPQEHQLQQSSAVASSNDDGEDTTTSNNTGNNINVSDDCDLEKKYKIALPGYPILVQDYIKLENAEKNLRKFASIQNVSVILLLGMKIKRSDENDDNGDDNDGRTTMQRDLGLINISNQELFDLICEHLLTNTDPNLQLKEIEDCKFLNGKFFQQQNIKASRKQIVPIIKSVYDKIFVEKIY